MACDFRFGRWIRVWSTWTYIFGKFRFNDYMIKVQHNWIIQLKIDWNKYPLLHIFSYCLYLFIINKYWNVKYACVKYRSFECREAGFLDCFSRRDANLNYRRSYTNVTKRTPQSQCTVYICVWLLRKCTAWIHYHLESKANISIVVTVFCHILYIYTYINTNVKNIEKK